MNRTFLVAIILVVALVAGALLAPRMRSVGLVRIRPAERPESGESLPEGTTVLSAAEAQSAVSPFALRPVEGAASASALVLAQGEASSDASGTAVWRVSFPGPGTYAAWVRAVWTDECGNSVSVQLEGFPARSVGQDAVYNRWHWVKAGSYEVGTPGERTWTMREREDGVAVDQVLFCPDPDFLPSGPVSGGAFSMQDLRRFADSFLRSPGHGLQDWEVVRGEWSIQFSLDPNRIPNQYSLLGTAAEADEPARLLLKGPPWNGVRVRCAVQATEGGAFGVVLRSEDEAGAGGGRKPALTVLVERDAEGGGRLTVSDGDGRNARPLGDAVRAGQWHRLCVERWATVLHVSLDGETLLRRVNLSGAEIVPGLVVGEGRAAFDDVVVEEIPCQAETPSGGRIALRPDSKARWYRPRHSPGEFALFGKTGTVRTPETGLPIAEAIAVEADSGVSLAVPPGFAEGIGRSGIRRFVPQRPATRALSLTAPQGKSVRLHTVAVRYGRDTTGEFRVGPYHFSAAKIEDSSDYLDFTEEEYRRIQESDDKDKLRRRAKMRALVGRGSKSVWIKEGGEWEILDGLLAGRGPKASLKYWEQFYGPLRFSCRVKLESTEDAAEIGFHERGGSGVAVRLAPPGWSQPASSTSRTLDLPVAADGAWHDVTVATHGAELSGRIDDEEAQSVGLPADRGDVLRLRVLSGGVAFDTVEWSVLRRTGWSRFYAFDRREPDWWREGGEWIDHGGIACALASNWISLVAPEGRGWLWNKSEFSSDLRVSFNVGENTEWFGWSEKPSHAHHPHDNICLSLGTRRDAETGYRLEVNSRDRAATVLYRNGEEFASVSQGEEFPMRYRGGHAPYAPRRNRIAIRKRQGELTVRINDRQVLECVDPNPLPVRFVGIGGYRTRINFTNVEILEASEEVP